MSNLKKILYTASRISHINNFHLPYIQYFTESGYQVDVLGEGSQSIPFAHKIYPISFHKKIFSPQNIKSLFSIANFLKEEQYDLIISNATLAGFLTRIALKWSGCKNTKLIHICHGYLFSKQSPYLKKNLYIIAEKICRKDTDVLLTMNQEDYELATKYSLCRNEIINIPGMGIPPFETKQIDLSRKKIRNTYGISDQDILMIYPAEFSPRKNHKFIIDTFPLLKSSIPNLKLLLPGDGQLLAVCRKKINQYNLQKDILTPGYIDNIHEAISASDIAVSSSKSEGLPFNIMEAMSFGLPVIASNVKGHVDLIEEPINGFLFDLDSVSDFHQAVKKCISQLPANYIHFNNVKKIKKYQLDEVFDKIISIYNRCLL